MGTFYVRVSLMEGMVELERFETKDTPHRYLAVELAARLVRDTKEWGWEPEQVKLEGM